MHFLIGLCVVIALVAFAFGVNAARKIVIGIFGVAALAVVSGELRDDYEKAIRFSHEFGLNDLSNYVLYNFHDTPQDLFERMYPNVRLNEELSIRIYSFPMR